MIDSHARQTLPNQLAAGRIVVGDKHAFPVGRTAQETKLPQKLLSPAGAFRDHLCP